MPTTNRIVFSNQLDMKRITISLKLHFIIVPHYVIIYKALFHMNVGNNINNIIYNINNNLEDIIKCNYVF